MSYADEFHNGYEPDFAYEPDFDEDEPDEKRNYFLIRQVVMSTDRAIYVELACGSTSWFPKSCCEIEGDKLYVPTWLYKRKNKEFATEQAVKDLQ